MPNFLEGGQSHFFERFGSFVMTKMSNKRGLSPLEGDPVRGEFLEGGSATFLGYEKLGESILL